MGKSSRYFAGLLTVAFLIVGVTGDPAMAQGKTKKEVNVNKASVPTKVLFDDDRVRVQEVTFKAGDQGPNVARPFRVIRVLKGGTIQRTHPDGTTDNVLYKTGEVKVYEADKPFVPKNIGTSDIVFYVVALKDPKK